MVPDRVSGWLGKSVLSLAALVALLAITGCGSSTASAASSSNGPIVVGTYSGSIVCTGSDRFSNGAPTRHYSSTPHVAVVFASGQRLQRWTYLFLGRSNTVIQSSAVRPGQVLRVRGRQAHRQTRYHASDRGRDSRFDRRLNRQCHPRFGRVPPRSIYTLILERRATTTIRYEAEKVVVKLPRYRRVARQPGGAAHRGLSGRSEQLIPVRIRNLHDWVTC